MKLIKNFDEISKAYELVKLLEECGIPSKTNASPHLSEGVEVWIYINLQYSDALKLLNDTNHTVENPVNIRDFYINTESTEAKLGLEQLKNTLIKYGLTSIIVISIFIMYMTLKT